MFTQLLTMFAVVTLRALPLIVAAIYATKHDLDPQVWAAALVLAVLIQAIFFLVERKCTAPDMSYFRGLQVIAACMSTGWIYFDPFLICAGVWSAQLASCGMALTPNAPERYRALVRFFHRHRMHQ